LWLNVRPPSSAVVWALTQVAPMKAYTTAAAPDRRKRALGPLTWTWLRCYVRSFIPLFGALPWAG
jgi:hypothetical protein